MKSDHQKVQNKKYCVSESRTKSVRILVYVQTSSGLHVQQKNLDYESLRLLIEKEGSILKVSGLNHIYYIRNFMDMRVLPVIREQLHRKPSFIFSCLRSLYSLLD